MVQKYDRRRRRKDIQKRELKMRYTASILIVLGLFLETATLSRVAEAGCVGQQCCGYGQTFNYREQTCEVPGSGRGR